jgi:hypothetical protein
MLGNMSLGTTHVFSTPRSSKMGVQTVEIDKCPEPVVMAKCDAKVRGTCGGVQCNRRRIIEGRGTAKIIEVSVQTSTRKDLNGQKLCHRSATSTWLWRSSPRLLPSIYLTITVPVRKSTCDDVVQHYSKIHLSTTLRASRSMQLIKYQA